MKTLRPYQTAAIEATRRQLQQYSSTTVVLPTGLGKCLAKGTPVLMYDGTNRAVEDVRVGELLMGPDSRPRKVLSLARGREQMYRITPNDGGQSYTVNESHILSLKMTKGATKGSGNNGGIYTAGTIVNLSVREYLAKSKTFRHCAKAYRAAIDFVSKSVPIDPYLLGLWLGDGHTYSTTIYSVDAEIHDALASIAASSGMQLTVRSEKTCQSFRLNTGAGNNDNPFLTSLRRLGLIQNKHVPHQYKANSRGIRLSVLAGLLDSDGTLTADRTGYEYTTTIEALADDFVFIARSLGFRVRSVIRSTRCQTGAECLSWRITIFGDCDQIPCRIARKKARRRTSKKDVLVYGFTVKPVGEGDYYGFEIDGDRLFLHGDFTVLHNTVFASKLISEWEQGNCLFLAHTQELIAQAAERLEGELGYRPGVEMNVQAVEVDTIWQGGMTVVGSVQTMYGDRRLAKYSRHPFGLIVVDECHHATSATYKKVINHFQGLNPNLKVVGITATPNRADGTALGLMFESVAYQMSINDAVTQGWLVPVNQEYVVVDTLEFDGIKTKKNEFGEADFSASQLEDVLVQEEMLHKMAVPTIEKVGDRPTLIFTATVRHAHELAAVLNRYRDGSAAAVDGGTPKEQRKEIIRDFSAGRKQFLCNCAVLTEGFDAPACAAIVMARPTKSLSLYTQMLGRGLRPLPGVVDGIADAQERQLSIRISEKPSCLVLDFVGNSNHKLASSYDVLGGKYDVETRELAKREAQRERKDVSEVMEQAAALLAIERQWKEREHIRAKQVRYGAYQVDPFDGDSPEIVGSDYTGPKRGTATDSQVRLLVNLGVRQKTAEACSKKQAGAMIDNLGSTRCTVKQAKTLAKHGIDPTGIGMSRASRIIDAIAANGWRRPEELPA